VFKSPIIEFFFTKKTDMIYSKFALMQILAVE